MTETRNIEKIAKSAHLIKALNDRAAELKTMLDAFTEDMFKNPHYALSRSTDNFKIASEWRAVQELAASIGFHAESGRTEWTKAELAEIAMEKLSGFRAVARSTCPTSNLMEQTDLQVWLDIARGGFGTDWFWKAQREDEEFRAHYAALSAAAQAERAAKAEAEAAAKREEKNRKERERRAAQKGQE